MHFDRILSGWEQLDTRIVKSSHLMCFTNTQWKMWIFLLIHELDIVTNSVSEPYGVAALHAQNQIPNIKSWSIWRDWHVPSFSVWNHPYITSAHFLTHPSMLRLSAVLNVSKNGHFLNHPHTQSPCWLNTWMVPLADYYQTNSYQNEPLWTGLHWHDKLTGVFSSHWTFGKLCDQKFG